MINFMKADFLSGPKWNVRTVAKRRTTVLVSYPYCVKEDTLKRKELFVLSVGILLYADGLW